VEQPDAFQAAQNLTKAYSSLALFLFLLIWVQLLTGESFVVARSRDDEPRAYWTVVGVYGAGFVLLIVALILHTR
jgi:hypothetical protein